MRYVSSLEEALFMQMTLGDDRAVLATYVAGRKVYARNRADAAGPVRRRPSAKRGGQRRS